MPCTTCPPAPPLPVGPPVPPTPPAGPFPRAHQKTMWRCANGIWVPQTNQCVSVLGADSCDGRTGVRYTAAACANIFAAPPAAPASPGCAATCGPSLTSQWYLWQSTYDCNAQAWGTPYQVSMEVAESKDTAWYAYGTLSQRRWSNSPVAPAVPTASNPCPVLPAGQYIQIKDQHDGIATYTRTRQFNIPTGSATGCTDLNFAVGGIQILNSTSVVKTFTICLDAATPCPSAPFNLGPGTVTTIKYFAGAPCGIRGYRIIGNTPATTIYVCDTTGPGSSCYTLNWA